MILRFVLDYYLLHSPTLLKTSGHAANFTLPINLYAVNQ